MALIEAFITLEVSTSQNTLGTLSEGLRLKEISDFSQFTSFTQKIFRWSNFNTKLISTSLFVIFFNQHSDFLKILLMVLSHCTVWDFFKSFHIFGRGVSTYVLRLMI